MEKNVARQNGQRGATVRAKRKPLITLTKDLLAEQFRDKLGFPTREAHELLELILEQLKVPLEENKDVKITGFGTWKTKQKRARPGRNPHTGEKIEISARRIVVFHPADKLRDRIDNFASRASAEGQ